MDTNFSENFIICNTKGLHARSSAKFVNCAANYNCQVEVSYLGKTVDGTSLIQLMLLSPPKGEKINITTTGQQAEQALKALKKLINSGFGE